MKPRLRTKRVSTKVIEREGSPQESDRHRSMHVVEIEAARASKM